MSTPEIPQLEELDKNPYVKEETILFLDAVVWPSIDYLHNSEYNCDFFDPMNAGEDFEPPIEQPYTGLYDVDILASQRDIETAPGSGEYRRSATLTFNERLTEEEIKRGISIKDNTQLWQATTYIFYGRPSYTPMSVNTRAYVTDSSGATKLPSERENTIMHDYMRSIYMENKDFRTKLDRSRVLEIAALFIVSGVPEEKMDEMLDQFETWLNPNMGE